MSARRTHHVTADDGCTIGATVHGEGPPLVLLQGVVGDGDMDWGGVVEHLADRFTCHLPSRRGRGLSGDHPDLSPGRQLADVLTYIDSIEGPPVLAGWSGGATLALEVAAHSGAVSAVVPFEPGILSLMDEEQRAALGGALARTAELAAAGDLTGAARAFARFPFDAEEIAVADHAGYFEAAGRYVPNLLDVLRQTMESGGLAADDPAVLGAISAPVTVLLGSATKPFFTASARHVAGHVRHARVHRVPAAGHAAPLTHPAALAEAVTEALVPVRQPA